MKDKIDFKKIRWGIFAAAAGFAGFCAMLAVSNIFPFGTDTLLRVDLGIQYTDFLLFAKHSSLAEKLYSFSKSFGGSIPGLMAYYTLSPFNLILYLFSDANIELAVFFIIGAKFSFMAAAAYSFFASRYENGFANAAFGFIYRMYPFFARYYFNIIWLDVFALLPLLVLGTERIMHGKGRGLFTVCYVYALVSNYYIAYMASLFILLYFFYSAAVYVKLTVGQTVKKALEMAFTVAVSLMLASPVLIPAYLQIAEGKLADKEAFARTGSIFNRDMTVISLFEGTYMYENVPQLLFTAGCLVLIFALLFNRKTGIGYRLLSVAFLGFMAFSLYNPALYYVFHGFAWPEGFPFRHSFAYAFLLAAVCRHSVEYIDFRSGIAGAVLTLLCLAGGYKFYRYFDYLPWSAHSLKQTVLVVCVCVLLVLLMAKFTHRGRLLLCGFLAVCTLFNSCMFMKGEKDLHAEAHGVKPAGEYAQNYIATEKALSAAEPGFYRAEDISARPYNQPMALGYYGANHFSSTFDKASRDMSVHFGYPEMKYSTYYKSSLLTDSLLGIKYILAAPEEKVNSSYSLVQEGEKNLYHNPYALPVVFTADSREVEYAESSKEHIGAMFYALTGIKVYDGKAVDTAALSRAAAQLQEKAALVTKQDGGIIRCTAEGNWLLTTVMYDENWRIKVNGRDTLPEKFMDCFMAVPLPRGQCEVEMTYIPQGIAAGMVLQLAAVIILVVSAFAAGRKGALYEQEKTCYLHSRL